MCGNFTITSANFNIMSVTGVEEELLWMLLYSDNTTNVVIVGVTLHVLSHLIVRFSITPGYSSV